jgi:hypothetical protein
MKKLIKMKNLTLPILSFFFVSSSFTQNINIEKPTKDHLFTIEAFVGGPNLPQYYWEGEGRAIGPFGVQFGYRQKDKMLGFGLYASYSETRDKQGTSRRVQTSYCGSGCYGEIVEDHFATVENFKVYRAFIIPSLYLYATKSDNSFQFRFETGIGLKIKNYRYQLFPQEMFYTKNYFPIALRLAMNARYEIANNLGMSGTVALGGELFSFGIYYQF